MLQLGSSVTFFHAHCIIKLACHLSPGAVAQKHLDMMEARSCFNQVGSETVP